MEAELCGSGWRSLFQHPHQALPPMEVVIKGNEGKERRYKYQLILGVVNAVPITVEARNSCFSQN